MAVPNAPGSLAPTLRLISDAGVNIEYAYGGASEGGPACIRFAAEHPEVLGYTPCYCGCEREAGHKGNDDCFVAERNGKGDVTRWDPHGVT